MAALASLEGRFSDIKEIYNDMAKISNKFSGKTVCLDKANVDTDQIIPKQFLKSIKKQALVLFYLIHGDTKTKVIWKRPI